eukprot:537251-Amphidinium_carterae.1
MVRRNRKRAHAKAEDTSPTASQPSIVQTVLQLFALALPPAAKQPMTDNSAIQIQRGYGTSKPLTRQNMHRQWQRHIRKLEEGHMRSPQ